LFSRPHICATRLRSSALIGFAGTFAALALTALSAAPAQALTALGAGPGQALTALSAAPAQAASALSAPPAQAAGLTGNSCPATAVSQPFSQFGDQSDYALVPGGDFESAAAGWTLTDGAQVVAGSEPYGATGSVGSSSLSLPAGATATSPPVCIDIAHPTLRLFERTQGLALVLIQEIYQTQLGTIDDPIGALSMSPGWEPTSVISTDPALSAALSGDGGTAQVSFRFTTLVGAAQIDDVFLDPRMSR
jgi:hypothetical protein